MLVEERRQRVLDLVSQRGYVPLTDLARAIQVSESTIRRDLEFWDRKGAVRRTHGGAVYLGGGSSLPALEERSAVQLEEKRAIAVIDLVLSNSELKQQWDDSEDGENWQEKVDDLRGRLDENLP